ncbi:MAG: RrF2 family transcriptional regulator [Candidatus Methylomirabilia bacterium]
MLRFTKRSDYGLMAIHYIASHHAIGPISAKRIAETFHIPYELLAKILQRLARKGLITSWNGPKGGYFLTKAPEQITVGEVVRALEGPVQIVSCMESLGCVQYPYCNWRGPVQKIQASVIDLLNTMTLADLMRGPRPPVAQLSPREAILS